MGSEITCLGASVKPRKTQIGICYTLDALGPKNFLRTQSHCRDSRKRLKSIGRKFCHPLNKNFWRKKAVQKKDRARSVITCQALRFPQCQQLSYCSCMEKS